MHVLSAEQLSVSIWVEVDVQGAILKGINNLSMEI